MKGLSSGRQEEAIDAPVPIGALVGARWRRSTLLRFLVVGVLNTAVGYLLFLAALALLPGTTLALFVSTIAAILFNFLSTGSYVFGSVDPSRLLRFFGVYALVFLYNALALAALETIGVRPQVGGLLALPGAVAISFVLNRSIVFAGPR